MPESMHKTRFVSRLTRQTLALVLAGGRGSRLHSLTEWRAKPAVPFGGKFRIVDFPLSNCMNSGIRRIGVITQYKAHSLIKHVQRGWGFLRGEFNEFVELHLTRHDGPIRCLPEEIATGDWFKPEDITAWVESRPQDFAKGFVTCWKAWTSKK